MKAYELLYFVPSATDDEARAGVASRIESTITESNGTVDKVDEWGKRKLAYQIDAQTEADYYLVDFHADPANVAELDRILRINDTVMRHMIVRRTDRD